MPLSFNVNYNSVINDDELGCKVVEKPARFTLKTEISGALLITIGGIDSQWPVMVETTNEHIIALLEQNDTLREEVMKRFPMPKGDEING